MTLFKDYQEFVNTKWVKHEQERDFRHVITGLFDELGEIASLYKKKYRHGVDIDMDDLKMELGDVVFYCMVFGQEFIEESYNHNEYNHKYELPPEFDYLVFNIHTSSIFQRIAIHRDQFAANELLHYISYVCDRYFNFTIEDLIKINIKKLTKRHGKGQATLETDLNKNEDLEKEISVGK